MCYYLRFKVRTSRTVVAADITLENVRALKDLRDYEEQQEDGTPPELNARNWPKTIEMIEEWLRGCLGITKIPLAYVIREDEELPNDPNEEYDSLADEMIARAPIKHEDESYVPTYLTDRQRVWELLNSLTREHDCFTYIRPAQ